jgi:acetolactate synthase-1/2/3 large subunit
MNGQEFATAVQYDLPILVSSSTTACTARSACTRSGHYPGRVSRTLLKNPDFAAYARAFGGHGERVERTEEFAPALERAMASGTPASCTASSTRRRSRRQRR